MPIRREGGEKRRANVDKGVDSLESAVEESGTRTDMVLLFRRCRISSDGSGTQAYDKTESERDTVYRTREYRAMLLLLMPVLSLIHI